MPGFLEKARQMDARLKAKLRIEQGPLVLEEEKPRTKPPTWPEIFLFAAAGTISTLGGLMFTGMYYIFYPVPVRAGFLVFLLGISLTVIFCWLYEQNSKEPDNRPPGKSSDTVNEEERPLSDGKERQSPLFEDPS